MGLVSRLGAQIEFWEGSQWDSMNYCKLSRGGFLSNLVKSRVAAVIECVYRARYSGWCQVYVP